MRCLQMMGMPAAAHELLLAKALRNHCGRDSGYVHRIVVASSFDSKQEGSLGGFVLREYMLQDNLTATEFVQKQIWSSGPVVWLGLRLSDGTQILWPPEELDAHWGASDQEWAMRELPITLSKIEVRALRDGGLTQLRRLVVPDPPHDATFMHVHAADYDFVPALAGKLSWFIPDANDLWPCNREDAIVNPFGDPGDHLWVRETWAPRQGDNGDDDPIRHYVKYHADPYFYDRSSPSEEGDWHSWPHEWRQADDMPRWASRSTFIVVARRVEKLSAMKDADFKACGIIMVPFRPDDGFPICEGWMMSKDDKKSTLYPTAREAFAHFWNDGQGEPGCTFADDPWSWVVDIGFVEDSDPSPRSS